MRIGLNLLHAMPSVGGVWNYVDSFLRALSGADSVNEYVVYVTTRSLQIVPEAANFRPVLVDVDASVRARRVLYEHMGLPLAARRDRIDCMHWFGNTRAAGFPVPSVVTVHDLMVLSRPESFTRTKRAYLTTLLRLNSRDRNGTRFCPVSEATARDLHAKLRVTADRVLTIPFMVQPMFRRASASVVESFRGRLRLPEQFWLYVSHTYRHKNHVRLLEALGELKSRAGSCWPLVLRGDPRDGEGEVGCAIQRLGLSNDVIRLPSMTYSELPTLYSAATALVFPSTFEGIGLPVVEAMACGCPSAVADLPSVREAAADASLYCDPYSTQSIADAMMSLQSDEPLRAELRRRGEARTALRSAGRLIGRLMTFYGETSRKGS